MNYLLPAGFIFILYTTILKEVSLYFNQQYYLTAIKQEDVSQYNYDWLSFKSIWLMNYSASFLLITWFANLRFFKNQLLNRFLGGSAAILIAVYLIGGLEALEDLRDAYLQNDAWFVHGFWNIGVRYLCYLFMGGLLYQLYSVAKQHTPAIVKWERLFFHFTILTILSSELLSWLALSGVEDGSRLALSILWGAYALYLIVWGLAKDFAFLRMGGIVLFGITLAKLFLYDLTDMSTIAKTIVLMVLGALLLIASFIYNKRKKNQTPTDETQA